MNEDPVEGISSVLSPPAVLLPVLLLIPLDRSRDLRFRSVPSEDLYPQFQGCSGSQLSLETSLGNLPGSLAEEGVSSFCLYPFSSLPGSFRSE